MQDFVQDPYVDPEEEARLEQERIIERLEMLGGRLQVKLKDYIGQREPIERRMIEDMRQYHCRYDADTEAQMADAKNNRSKVFANITRSKTNAAEARISDMLFPADDKNWSIGPTPIPESSKEAQGFEGQAAQNQALAPQQMPGMPQQAPADPEAMAKKAAQGMTRVIDDQLNECQYNIQARRMIHQAAVLGTGVLKGPIIVSKRDRKWDKMDDPATGQSVRVLQIDNRTAPAVEWIDVWNFFPDLSAKTVEECEAIYERKFISRRQLKELARRPGYLKDQIAKVLESGPKEYSTTSDHLQKMREIAGITGVQDDTRFELWEYHGPVDTEDLRACGCDVEDDDVFADREGVVIFIGDVVIFADINHLETGERPFAVWNWEEDESCMFGYGVPYLMRTPQRILNSAWRMMMDNSGTAVGPQIAVKSSKVQPSNGKWAIEPMKLWFITDPNIPVNDAFATFDINSHQGELANIIQIAKTFADEETNLPMIAQGERGTAPDTATGMSMLMNAANTVLRRMVKAFDDYITKPMITRFYDYNMQNHPDEAVKGDFEVDARGTTALLVKELQTQQLMAFGNFYAHPTFGPILAQKAPNMLRRIAESLRLSPDDVIPTDEELQQQQAAAAQQPAPMPPQLQVAQIRAEAEMKRAEYQASADQNDMNVRLQLAQQDYQYKIQALQLEREIEMLRLASTKELTLEQIKAKLADTTIKETSKKQLFSAEQQLKMQTGSGI
jgi:hypothetical protein